MIEPTDLAAEKPAVPADWLYVESLDLEALRGKIVLLDFWTFCCINCLHVLDELRPLEEHRRVAAHLFPHQGQVLLVERQGE